MIETSWDDAFDLKAALPRGSRVALLGCASCASVYRTGDTERLEAVATLLEGHVEVVLQASIEAPCDQRVLRYLAKTLPGFERAERFVVLACEAGSRSVAALTGKPVVSPVRTRGFSVLRTDGASRRACLFCDPCRFPDKGCPCPVAACPLERTDGPCQTRTAKRCVFDPSMDCSWLVERPGLPDSPPKGKPARLFPLPAAVVATPATLDGVAALGARQATWKRLGTLFLAEARAGLAPLVAAARLAGGAGSVALGVGLRIGSRGLEGWEQEGRTALALGVGHVWVMDPEEEGPEVPGSQGQSQRARARGGRTGSCDTLEALEALAGSARSGTEKDGKTRLASLAVLASFLHPGDVTLLAAQFAAGASVVVSPLPEGHLQDAARRFADRGVRLLPTPPASLAGHERCLVDLRALDGEAVLEVGDRLFR